MNTKTFIGRVAAAIMGVLVSGAGTAADSTAAGADKEKTSLAQRTYVEEIVVTAERREMSLQRTPLAVSAFSADEILRSDLTSLENIQFQVPGLQYAEQESYSFATLRGVGIEFGTSAGESGIAFNLDGVYMPRSSTSSAILSDLERIEVLRGPQGTLYGRNTPGGAINIWTKVPLGETEGDLSVLFGYENRLRVRGGVSFPIGEQLAARVSFASDAHDGYRKNLTNGKQVDDRDHESVRGVLRWTPTDDVEMLLRYSYSRDDNGGPVFQYGTVVIPELSPFQFGARADPDPRKLRSERDVDITAAYGVVQLRGELGSARPTAVWRRHAEVGHGLPGF